MDVRFADDSARDSGKTHAVAAATGIIAEPQRLPGESVMLASVEIEALPVDLWFK